MEQKIDVEQVRKVAKLARLELNDAEISEFTGQLGAILEYVEKMNELDTADVEPLAHCLPISNVFRDDEINRRWGPRRLWPTPRAEMGRSSKCRRSSTTARGPDQQRWGRGKEAISSGRYRS